MLDKINLQLFAEGDPEESISNDAETNPDEKATQKTKTNELPKTQEELDTLINARIARERKNAAKQSKTTQEGKTEDPNNTRTEQQGETTADDTAREMLIVRTQLEAYKSGQIRSECVEDAVDLAMAALSKSATEPTNDALKEALNAILSRHPEWKADDKQKGGFKVGSDGENDNAQQQKVTEAPNKKRWNKWQ